MKFVEKTFPYGFRKTASATETRYTHGLANAGINVVAGYDIDEACRFAYEANNSSKITERIFGMVFNGWLPGFFGTANTKATGSACLTLEPDRAL